MKRYLTRSGALGGINWRSISNPFESFSKDKFVAERFTGSAQKPIGVLLEVRGAKSAKDMQPLIEKFAKFKNYSENEVMFSRGKRFKILSQKKLKQDGAETAHLVLEELL